MFFDLLRAEVLRLTYRRRATWSLLLMVVVGLILPTQWMPSAEPLGPADYDEAAYWMQQGIANGDCAQGCQLSEYLRWVASFDDVVESITGANIFLALLVFFIALTYVGSDFASGALGTQLTFTPRRGSVLAARIIGAGLLGATLMGIGAVVSICVSIVWYLALNGFGSVTAAHGLLTALASAVAYGAFIGVIAALLVFIFGGVVLAGVAAMLALVAEGLVESYYWPAPEAWPYHLLPGRQAEALLTGSSNYSFDTLTGSIERGDAVGYHLIVIAVLAAVAYWVFRRRDINS